VSSDAPRSQRRTHKKTKFSAKIQTQNPPKLQRRRVGAPPGDHPTRACISNRFAPTSAALGRPAAARLRTFAYSGGPLKRCIGFPSHLRAGHVGSPPPRIERGGGLMWTRHRRTVRWSLSPSRAAVSRYGSRLPAAHSPGGCPGLLVKRVARGHAYRGGCPGPCSVGARIARVVCPLKVCAVRALSAIL